MSRFCIAPLDVVKIRLQLQPHSLSDPLSCDGIKGPIYKGAFRTLAKIAREEGIRALWKGNIPAEAMYVAYGGIQFTAYRTFTQAQALLPQRPPPSVESFISGAVAGAFATTATYPLDLLRTRFAAQGQERIYAGLWHSVRDIARQEGPKGFFRGLNAALGQIVPYMGLFFTSYEFLHQYIGGKTLPFGSGDATAGVFASVFAKTAVFPLDLVRKRLQVQGPTRTRYIHTNIPEYRGVILGLAAIWKREGYRGWYRGLTVSLLKVGRSCLLSNDFEFGNQANHHSSIQAAPASAVTMWTYERVLHSLINSDRNDEMWEMYTGYDDDYDD